MVAFNKMWKDINEIMDHSEAHGNFDKKQGVFLIKEGEDIVFLTKDDFIDFWSNMLLRDKVDKKSLNNKNKLLYVYDLVKKLPYVNEKDQVLCIDR
ncbi:hypothetical protein SAMN02745163_00886 [Clostridium cavendishii DSM 21758]|uniref:Uncharacterized protein n=1 Tax=Clostridium cavendishii DSM 21758 TaxID=1121302 RepID=A0A1M6EM59_9CLOT|nr:hypothetical protein [Clostridium cavendishii]SHI86479.1 hypothetical protein SAMN02745163_00886 [Clostridium cavendishii DSM 21758]